MCLVVYLGLDEALPNIPALEAEKFGLRAEREKRPQTLSDRNVVYEVCEWGGERWWCACDLHYHYLPWETLPIEPQVAAAYEFLQSILSEAIEANLGPQLFSCWADNEQRNPEVTWKVAVEHLIPQSNLFDDYERTGGGLPPVSLFSFNKGLSDPEPTYHAQH